MTIATADSQPRWLSTLVTSVMGALSVALSIVFTFAIIAYAYAYAFAEHRIGSYDQLPLLGGGPSAALASAWLPGIIGSFAGLVVLFTPGHRHAWMFPGAGIALSLVLVVVCCLTFQQPAPMTGG